MDKLEKLKKWLLITGIGTLFIALIFSIPNSLDIRTWVDTQFDLAMIIGIAAGAVIIVNLSMKIKSHNDNIKEIRDLFIKRINADLCQCNKPCNHKESYLDDVSKICKINLYY
jgi:hypothetical protein